MKQRNKETGEIFEVITFGYINSGVPNGNGDYPVEFVTIEAVDEEGDLYEFRYKSLKDLNAMWEDYNPQQPLIKDEKIRKAVRAWAEAVDADSAFVEKGAYENDRFVLTDELAEISFRINTPNEIKSCKRYTIAELCGEEE